MRFFLLLSLLFLCFQGWSLGGEDTLVVRNFPTNVSTIDEVLNHLKETIPKDKWEKIQIVKQGESLRLELNGETYNLLIHKNKIIQQSTATDRILKAQDGHLQFGRTSERLGLPLLQESPEGKRLLELLEKTYHYSLKEGESVNKFLNEHGYRGMNEFKENEKYRTVAKSILTATNHAEHPAMIMSHELQHLLNHYVLDDLIEKLPKEFTRGDPQNLKAIKEMFDEYLAVKRSLEVYQSLIDKYPHIATTELSKLSQMPDVELKKYVVEKWTPFYKWDKSFSKIFLELPSQLNVTIAATEEAVSKLRLRNDLKPPQEFAEKIHYEQSGNDFTKIHENLASPLRSDLRMPFRPSEGNIFEIPYVELSPSEIDIVGKNNLPDFYHAENGKIKYFIHPQSIAYYQSKIPNLNLKWGEYAASALASNRSLVVWEIKNSANSRLVKVSLDATIGGALRMNKPIDLAHSVVASELIKEIPDDFWKKHNVSVLVEDSAFTPKDVEFGFYDKRYLTPIPSNVTEVPAFAMYSELKGEYLIEKLARAENLPLDQFYREKVLKPLTEFYTELYLNYGIMPEAHAQNMSILIKDGKLAGFTMLDMGGVNIDPEMRALKGLKTEPEKYLNHFKDVYKNADYIESAKGGASKLIDVYFKQNFTDGFAKIWAEKKNIPIELSRLGVYEDVDIMFADAYKKQTGVPLAKSKNWSERFKKPFKEGKVVLSVGKKCSVNPLLELLQER